MWGKLLGDILEENGDVRCCGGKRKVVGDVARENWQHETPWGQQWREKLLETLPEKLGHIRHCEDNVMGKY